MRDNFWSQIGSTAVVCQNKQLAERGISEESCQPRTLAISLQYHLFISQVNFQFIFQDILLQDLFFLTVFFRFSAPWRKQNA